MENELKTSSKDSDLVKVSKKLQKHIGDHVLNFSLLAFLEPEEWGDSPGSDAINVRDSQSSMISSAQSSDHELRGTDDIERRAQEEFHQTSLTTDVPELKSDIDWETVQDTIREKKNLPELPENDPKLVTFVARSAESRELLGTDIYNIFLEFCNSDLIRLFRLSSSKTRVLEMYQCVSCSSIADISDFLIKSQNGYRILTIASLMAVYNTSNFLKIKAKQRLLNLFYFR